MAIKHVFKESSGPCLLRLNATSLPNALEDRSLTPFTLKLTPANSSPHGDDQSQKPISLAVEDHRTLSHNDGSEFEEQAEMHFLFSFSSKNLNQRNIIEHNNPDEDYKWTKNREVKSTCGPSFNTERQSNHDCYEAVQKGRSTVSEYPIEGKVLENSGKSSQTISVAGIISRFFSELDEVDSCYFQPNELRNSKIRNLASQPDQMSDRKSVVSEADTQSSFASFAKKEEGNTDERGKAALMVKKQQLGSKKQFNKKSLLCTSQISSRMFIETLSNKSWKYKVGKRLVQAANSIQASGSGKRSATKSLSKFKNLTCSDSGSFVRRRIAFDVDDFND